jgi:Ca2+-binding EF-hand superfamily protein
MMKQFSRVLLVVAAVAALPGSALAGGGRGKSPECRAAFDARHLPTYDSNRDGTLDRGERQALRRDRRQQALARYDADRDGSLSEVERVKMRRDRVAEKLGRLDRNRDGAIDRSEASGPCSRLARRFDRIDADRDGRITAAELSAVRMSGKR